MGERGRRRLGEGGRGGGRGKGGGVGEGKTGVRGEDRGERGRQG